MVGVMDKMDGSKEKEEKAMSWSSQEVKFLVREFDIAQETWPPQNSPSRECCHVGILVISSSLPEILVRRSLDDNENPSQWRTHFVADHNAPFP